MSDLAKIVAAHQGKGYITAPAGFGKTHLIAAAITYAGDRQLILTHTYAGVNALRHKLRTLGVPHQAYRVTTIAGWALQLCLSYPENADWHIDYPEGDEWQDLYEKCGALFQKPFIRKVFCASYGGIYVDEYQDCTAGQHELIQAMARILPTRILGDPLQGIFDFERVVNWETQVVPEFECLGHLDCPWRWKNAGTDELGHWLKTVRHKLDSGEPLDLTGDIPNVVTVHICSSDDQLRNKQITTCKYFDFPSADNVAGLHKGDNHHKARCHLLAKSTGGRFASIEEIEGKRLHDFVKSYDRKQSAQERLIHAIEFLRDKCMSGVNDALSAGTKRGEVVKLRNNTRNPDLVRAANDFLAASTAYNLKLFILALKAVPDTDLYARDLFNRLIRVLTNCMESEDDTLSASAARFQREFRHTGRPLRQRKILGTTLLLKGLEFDHAIVLDAASLSKKDLYVALTRGSKSLTILSKSEILDPTC